MADIGSAGAGDPPQSPRAEGLEGRAIAPASSDKASDHPDFANPTINMIRTGTGSQKSSSYSSMGPSREGTPPPLPPRPKLLAGSRPSTSSGGAPPRPHLVSKATTQLSYSDTQTYSQESGSSGHSRPPRNFFGFNRGLQTSDGDNESILSFAPTADMGLEAESMLGDVPGGPEKSLLRTLGHRFSDQESGSLFPPDPEFEESFAHEFHELEGVAEDGSNEGRSGSLCRRTCASIWARADTGWVPQNPS